MVFLFLNICIHYEPVPNYPKLIAREHTVSENQLDHLAKELLPLFSKNNLVLLYGQMGAGKTRFVRSLANLLECTDEVGSPTFSIINEYHVKKNDWNINRIYHLDLYRLKSIQEALDIGISEYLYGQNLCIIEWPQLVEDLIANEPHLKIHIEVLANQQRRFILTV